MTAGPSNNIFISPGTAANLVIQTQPNAQVTAGDNLTDPIVIDEEDQYGNIVTDDNSTVVTASLASGPGSLKGVKTATVVAGVASFDDLEDDTAGTLTLKFAAGDLLSIVRIPPTCHRLREQVGHRNPAVVERHGGASIHDPAGRIRRRPVRQPRDRRQHHGHHGIARQRRRAACREFPRSSSQGAWPHSPA